MIDFNAVANWLSPEGELGRCLCVFHDEEGLDAAVAQLTEMGKLNTEVARQTLLYAHSFGDSHYTLRFLCESFVRTGLLDKQALLAMYHAQSESARLAISPFLTLEDLMCSCGDYKAVASYTHFTKSEILAIAEQVRDIHVNDLWRLIGKSGFYEKDIQAFSDDFLRHWYQKVLNDTHGDQIEGLLASFILMRVYDRIPNAIKSADVMKVARQISRKDPSGHGVHRCLQLIGTMAAESECENAWASFSADAVILLIRMIERNSSDGLNTLVHTLQLMNYVSDDLRKEILLEARRSCRRIALMGLRRSRVTLYSGIKMVY